MSEAGSEQPIEAVELQLMADIIGLPAGWRRILKRRTWYGPRVTSYGEAA